MDTSFLKTDLMKLQLWLRWEERKGKKKGVEGRRERSRNQRKTEKKTETDREW